MIYIRGKASEILIETYKLVYPQPNYSSAFEVWINYERVWSKLKTGHVPTLEELHYIIFFELPRIRAKYTFIYAVLGLAVLILPVEDKPPRTQALRRIRKTPQRAIR